MGTSISTEEPELRSTSASSTSQNTAAEYFEQSHEKLKNLEIASSSAVTLKELSNCMTPSPLHQGVPSNLFDTFFAESFFSKLNNTADVSNIAVVSLQVSNLEQDAAQQLMRFTVTAKIAPTRLQFRFEPCFAEKSELEVNSISFQGSLDKQTSKPSLMGLRATGMMVLTNGEATASVQQPFVWEKDLITIQKLPKLTIKKGRPFMNSLLQVIKFDKDFAKILETTDEELEYEYSSSLKLAYLASRKIWIPNSSLVLRRSEYPFRFMNIEFSPGPLMAAVGVNGAATKLLISNASYYIQYNTEDRPLVLTCTDFKAPKGYETKITFLPVTCLVEVGIPSLSLLYSHPNSIQPEEKVHGMPTTIALDHLKRYVFQRIGAVPVMVQDEARLKLLNSIPRMILNEFIASFELKLSVCSLDSEARAEVQCCMRYDDSVSETEYDFLRIVHYLRLGGFQKDTHKMLLAIPVPRDKRKTLHDNVFQLEPQVDPLTKTIGKYTTWRCTEKMDNVTLLDFIHECSYLVPCSSQEELAEQLHGIQVSHLELTFDPHYKTLEMKINDNKESHRLLLDLNTGVAFLSLGKQASPVWHFTIKRKTPTTHPTPSRMLDTMELADIRVQLEAPTPMHN